MSGQGYHLALHRDQVDEVMSCNDEMGILDWVDQALGEFDWDAGLIHGGYKDWNILLACLTNGNYDPKGGTYPLNRCFFGGRLLVTDGSIVNLVMPEEVVDVAEALSMLDENDFRSRYRKALPAFPSSIRPIAIEVLRRVLRAIAWAAGLLPTCGSGRSSRAFLHRRSLGLFLQAELAITYSRDSRFSRIGGAENPRLGTLDVIDARTRNRGKVLTVTDRECPEIRGQ